MLELHCKPKSLYAFIHLCIHLFIHLLFLRPTLIKAELQPRHGVCREKQGSLLEELLMEWLNWVVGCWWGQWKMELRRQEIPTSLTALDVYALNLDWASGTGNHEKDVWLPQSQKGSLTAMQGGLEGPGQKEEGQLGGNWDVRVWEGQELNQHSVWRGAGRGKSWDGGWDSTFQQAEEEDCTHMYFPCFLPY